jgi:hypothetical protein
LISLPALKPLRLIALPPRPLLPPLLQEEKAEALLLQPPLPPLLERMAQRQPLLRRQPRTIVAGSTGKIVASSWAFSCSVPQG